MTPRERYEAAKQQEQEARAAYGRALAECRRLCALCDAAENATDTAHTALLASEVAS